MLTKRPIIAVTGDTIEDPSVFTTPNTVDIAPTMFKAALLQAGGIPIILPIPEPSVLQAAVDSYLPLFDGLLLPGGPDVDPACYNQQPLPQLGTTNPPRDAFELALIRAAYQAQKPILGLCRGSHILNVAFGGTLYQDLESQKPNALRHLQRSSGEFPTHHVSIAADTQLSSLIGTKAFVNSRHHQAVRQVGQGLKVAATAADGTIEAFESRDSDLILGLQWHPENLWQEDRTQLAIYTDFVRKALAHRHQTAWAQ